MTNSTLTPAQKQFINSFLTLNISVEDFNRTFEERYDYFYDNNDPYSYNDIVLFDNMLKSHKSAIYQYITKVANYRQDIFTSDRECAAFVSAMRIFVSNSTSQKPAPLAVSPELIEKYCGAGCTFGNINKTKYIQRVNVVSPWGNIIFLYHGTRAGAFSEIKKQFPGFVKDWSMGNTLYLYFAAAEDNIEGAEIDRAEVVARCEQLDAARLTASVIAWHIRLTAFAPLPLALPAIGTPDTTPATTAATPSPVKKSVNWDELTEEERHPMPAFYTDLRDLARSHNQECAATYRLAAEIIDDSLTKNPDAWRDFIPGMFLNLDDCGLKMDGANHIGAAISEMVYSDQPKAWNDGKSGVTPRLCMIEKIIDCTDEDLQLFEYNNDLPEGCALGGGRCDDDEAQARALARMREKYIMPKEREAAEQKYYSYFFTLVTMYRSTNYCVFIDAEGFSWCRYLLFLPSWRTMYAADVQAAVEKEQRRQEEAAADRLIEETNALLKYNADCDRLRPYMVADLSALQLNDRQGRQNGRRRNILSALRHFFPGQKFSVKYRWSSHDEIEITWTDGPTQEEVENCCNWSIFCDTWRHFDGMTDSTSTGDRKFTNFAQQYGGGFLNEISFDRYYSESRSEAAKATARDILAAHGIAPDSGAHQTTDEYPAIWNDIANRYGRHVADWLHNWSWLDTYAISRAILANNADRPAA